jgi:hypothetical protein
MPGLVLSNMSVVNPHLQLGESYVMRNAVLHAIGHTLIELSRMIQRERTDTALKTREALLQIMRERVNDVNAFTRSKVLQVWAVLCEKDAIPKKTQPAVVLLATVRLEDKSGQVRKSAPHTTMCPHTTIYVSSYYYMCPHTTVHVSSYYYICVLILLYVCPRTACRSVAEATERRGYVSSKSAFVDRKECLALNLTLI